MTSQTVDVLVVGAGPAGLTAAAALRRYGVDVLVLERKARLSAHPRATVVSTRSMELLRSWGLEEEMRAGGLAEVEWLGLVVAGGALASLVLEPGSLIVRIVELAERVGQLHSLQDQLEPLDQAIVGPVRFGQR